MPILGGTSVEFVYLGKRDRQWTGIRWQEQHFSVCARGPVTVRCPDTRSSWMMWPKCCKRLSNWAGFRSASAPTRCLRTSNMNGSSHGGTLPRRFESIQPCLTPPGEIFRREMIRRGYNVTTHPKGGLRAFKAWAPRFVIPHGRLA